MAVRASLWTREGRGGNEVRCRLCSHYCLIPDTGAGRCRVRGNRSGVLYSSSSDDIRSANLDPVEKKPLFHYLPGTLTFSLGTPGCNMSCAFCQNHGLSQAESFSPGSLGGAFPASLAARILESAVTSHAASVSFTYNEPIVSFELIEAVAPRALEAGLGAVLVSNAYASKECMAVLKGMIRAVNFDLKAFSDTFYRTLCGARLTPVLRTLVQAASFGWWMEITTLLIPGHNDSDAELRNLARFIKEELGENVPWHISRFRPMYRMASVPATPVAALERARAIGLAEGLRFVYTGNVPGHEAENTCCPRCGELFIARRGYRADAPRGSCCARCGEAIAGVWGV